MNYKLFATAAILMSIAVILGALGAHALERHLPSQLLQSFETGVRYLIYHGISLLVIATVYSRFTVSQIKLSVRLMLAGVFCFSGSIFAFAIGHVIHLNISSWLWWITPLGGLLLISSWIVLFMAALSQKKADNI